MNKQTNSTTSIKNVKNEKKQQKNTNNTLTIKNHAASIVLAAQKENSKLKTSNNNAINLKVVLLK
jgi:hypothetical protein